MNRDPDKITERLIERGESWADLDAAASALEETRKSVLAERMQDHASEAKSMAEREMKALADQTYKDFVTGMVEDRRKANRARVRFDAMKIWVELLRSHEATRRAEASIR